MHPRVGAPHLRQTCRDPAQGKPESTMKLREGRRSGQRSGPEGLTGGHNRSEGDEALQGMADVGRLGARRQFGECPDRGTRPQAALFRRFRCRWPLCGDAAASAQLPEGGYYGPRLLPAPEVYTVLRDNGFSPLGAPQQRGMFYTIAVLDRSGGEGRLVIDARDGRIVRYARGYPADPAVAYGSPGAPPVSAVRGPPRPPGLVPHVASRTPIAVPLPKAMPEHSDAAADRRQGHRARQRTLPRLRNRKARRAGAAIGGAGQAGRRHLPTPAATPPAVIEAKPARSQIQPTKEMPKVQGLE